MKTFALIIIGFVLIGVLGMTGYRNLTQTVFQNSQVTEEDEKTMAITGIISEYSGEESGYILKPADDKEPIRIDPGNIDVSLYENHTVVLTGMYSDGLFVIESIAPEDSDSQ